jgi:hypothetical protein
MLHTCAQPCTFSVNPLGGDLVDENLQNRRPDCAVAHQAVSDHTPMKLLPFASDASPDCPTILGLSFFLRPSVHLLPDLPPSMQNFFWAQEVIGYPFALYVHTTPPLPIDVSGLIKIEVQHRAVLRLGGVP